MQELYWLDSHIGTIEDAKEIAKQFTWRLTITTHENVWYVYDGEAKIFSSSSKEALEAFLYGLALAYAVIPDPYNGQLKKDLQTWIDSQ